MAESSNARVLRQRIDLWNQTHPGKQIDPAAEFAVARQEGLSGGIGDNGTSFGPNQLHYSGAYPQSAPHGAAASQAWAWSPAGIDYTLGQIANVAGGERGPQAVRDIVSRFERPANPGREIAHALAAYGGGSQPAASWGTGAPAASWGTGTPPDMGAPPAGGSRRQLLLALASGFDQPSAGLTPFLSALTRSRTAPPPQFSPLPTASAPLNAQPLPAASGQHVLAELLHEGVGGPTHSTGDHIHVALTDPQAMLAAISEARALGLSVGENPYVGSVAPGVHAEHSYHKRQFPGLYNGRHLGEAIDVHGPREVQFQTWVKRRYG